MRRVLVLFVAIVSLLGTSVPCVGWTGSPVERMDCCKKGMSPGEVGDAGPSHDMAQDAANRCCATSEERNQQSASQSPSSFVAVAPFVASVAPHEAPAALEVPRHTAPPPALHARPLHLLLSVFLV